MSQHFYRVHIINIISLVLISEKEGLFGIEKAQIIIYCFM